MRARVASLPPRARIGLAAGAVVLYALVLWFLLIAPKRSEAASLSTQIAAAGAKLVQSRGATTAKPRAASTPAADVVRLAKALPPSADQAGLVLELSRLGQGAKVSIFSIEPGEPTTDTSGATFVPVTVTVTGTYGQVTRFLRGARRLVSFRGGKLHATGRVLAVTGVQLAESSSGKFPLLDATIALDAYAYDGPLAPTAPATPPPAEGSTSTSGATAAGGTS